MVKCRATDIKQKVKHKIKEYSNKQLMEATERKSKLKHLVETSYVQYTGTRRINNNYAYLNTNNRGECMLSNFQHYIYLYAESKRKLLVETCRQILLILQNPGSETQTHILEKCKEFETQTKYIDQHHLKKATEHITKIEAKQILQMRNKIDNMDKSKTREAKN